MHAYTHACIHAIHKKNIRCVYTHIRVWRNITFHVDTCIHTCTPQLHLNVHKHNAHTYMHMHMSTCTCTWAHAHAHEHMHIHIHIHIHIYTYTHVRVKTCKHPPTTHHPHKYIHIYANTRTHTDTHMYMHIYTYYMYTCMIRKYVCTCVLLMQSLRLMLQTHSRVGAGPGGYMRAATEDKLFCGPIEEIPWVHYPIPISNSSPVPSNHFRPSFSIICRTTDTPFLDTLFPEHRAADPSTRETLNLRLSKKSADYQFAMQVSALAAFYTNTARSGLAFAKCHTHTHTLHVFTVTIIHVAHSNTDTRFLSHTHTQVLRNHTQRHTRLHNHTDTRYTHTDTPRSSAQRIF